MKVRIISSMIGLVLLFVVFVFFDTVLTNLVIAFICTEKSGITAANAIDSAATSLSPVQPVAASSS